MPFCSRCGRETTDASRSCENCGQGLRAEPTRETPGTRWQRFVLPMVAVASIVVAAAVFLVPGKKTLSASSACRDFLAADSEGRAAVVKRIALQVHGPDAGNPSAVRSAEYVCGLQPEMQLGDAVSSATGASTTPQPGSGPPASSGSPSPSGRGTDGVVDTRRLHQSRFAGGVEVIIFLRPDATQPQVEAIGNQLDAMPEVAQVRYIDKPTSLAEFDANTRDQPDIRGSLTLEMIPPSYRIVPRAGAAPKLIGERLRDDDGVYAVVYAHE